MHDDVVFYDEQQRSYVSAGILMASYFDCLSVLMFDTGSRFTDKDDARKPSDYATASRPKSDGEDPEAQGTENSINWDDDQEMLVNSDKKLASDVDGSTYWDSDSDSGTDNGVDAGLEETGSLLWRHHFHHCS